MVYKGEKSDGFKMPSFEDLDEDALKRQELAKELLEWMKMTPDNVLACQSPTEEAFEIIKDLNDLVMQKDGLDKSNYVTMAETIQESYEIMHI